MPKPHAWIVYSPENDLDGLRYHGAPEREPHMLHHYIRSMPRSSASTRSPCERGKHFAKLTIGALMADQCDHGRALAVILEVIRKECGSLNK